MNDEQTEIERPLGRPGKLRGFDFYRAIGSPRYILAPMVDASELPWRILSRRFGAELCYTPMIHSKILLDVNDGLASLTNYRDEFFVSHEKDKPLFVQFCGNDEDILVKAAKIPVDIALGDAIDLNLGCPQGIAKRGHYGAFLMDEWPLIEGLIRALDYNLPVPITAKIRVFDDMEKTIKYAKMIQNAGAALVTVHGRTREMKGTLTGYADWQYIKRVKEVLDVPVIANGNVLYFDDIERCMRETGCDGVMVAETNLQNPAVFVHNSEGIAFGPTDNSESSLKFYEKVTDYERYPLLKEHPPAHLVCLEYVRECMKLPEGSVRVTCARGHVFKLLRFVFPYYLQMREIVGRARKLEILEQVLIELGNQLERDILEPPKEMQTWSWDWLTEEGKVLKTHTDRGVAVLGEHFRLLPFWVLQPYIRPPSTDDDDSEDALLQEARKIAESMSEKELAEVEAELDEDASDDLVAIARRAVMASHRSRYLVLRAKRKMKKAEYKQALRENPAKKHKKAHKCQYNNCNAAKASSCTRDMCRKCCRAVFSHDLLEIARSTAEGQDLVNEHHDETFSARENHFLKLLQHVQKIHAAAELKRMLCETHATRGWLRALDEEKPLK